MLITRAGSSTLAAARYVPARVAEVDPVTDQVVVHQWLKQAILLLFRLRPVPAPDPGEDPGEHPPSAGLRGVLAGLRFAVPENLVLDGLDATVATGFAHALSVLEHAGVRLVHTRFPEFEEILTVNAKGGFAASEAYAWHRALLARQGDGYDPRIRVRIARGEHMSAADYLDVVAARARLVTSFDARTAEYDCVLMPTVPIVPPVVADLDDEREYNRVNMLILRNTALGNFLDRCAISLPCHGAGEAPVGLMLMGETLGDARLFAIAAGVEAALAG